MARVQLRLGDSDPLLPLTFQGETIQQAILFRDSGVIDVTTTDCSIYPYLNGLEQMKTPRNSTRSYPVQTGQTYDVEVAGTTDTQPSGSIAYNFHA